MILNIQQQHWYSYYTWSDIQTIINIQHQHWTWTMMLNKMILIIQQLNLLLLWYRHTAQHIQHVMIRLLYSIYWFNSFISHLNQLILTESTLIWTSFYSYLKNDRLLLKTQWSTCLLIHNICLTMLVQNSTKYLSYINSAH